MSNTINRWFVAHPHGIGETYGEHFGIAARFGLKMIAGGIACLVHALVPAVFERTGSGVIKRLYSDLVARQPGHAKPAYDEPDWQAEYEI